MMRANHLSHTVALLLTSFLAFFLQTERNVLLDMYLTSSGEPHPDSDA